MEQGRPSANDSQLLRQAQQGDERAFHELVDRHAGHLYGLAVSLVGSAADADDVLQETFAAAASGLQGFRHEASVKTWLTRILVRQAAMHHRRRLRHRTIALDSQELAQGGQSGQQRADLRLDVAGAIGRLSQEHRQVIVLRELEHLSYDEIAAILDVPRGTVESRLSRARKAMQELLKEYLE